MKAGERLDRAICESLRAKGHEVSVREVKQALAQGRILVNGKRARPGTPAQGDEIITLQGFTPKAEAIVPKAPSEVVLGVARVHEDQQLLVLDKPSGMPTQPLRSDEQGTLLSVAIAIDPQIAKAGPPLEGGLVHRLDRGTSGLVIFAKSKAVRAQLREAFSNHQIPKRYLALTKASVGPLRDAPKRIESPLIAKTKQMMRIAAENEPGAQSASSEVHLLKEGAISLVEVRTSTGRRHQVRVHLASIGLSILGDAIYGDADQQRLALHASMIALPDGRRFEAPLPEELRGGLKAL